MDFEFTTAQLELKLEIQNFVKAEAATYSKEFERESIFPRELYLRTAAKGWLGPIVPEEYGGMGKGAMEYVIICQEFFRSLLMYTHMNVQLEQILLTAGTEEQKRKYLPKLASGEYLAANLISEPHAGSSLKNLQTKAEKGNGYYLVSGHKTHINLATEANCLGVLVRTEKGLSYLIMEKDTSGIRFSEKLDPVSARELPMYDVYFEQCKVPRDQLIGEEGKGLAVFLSCFNLSRIGNAAAFTGLARGCLERAIDYAQKRKVGDNYVTDFQGIRWMIAELTTELEAAELLVYKAAWANEVGKQHALEASQAKLYAGDMAERVASKAFSLVGAYGWYRTSPIEHYWRRIKGLQIGGGTAEIQKSTIADQLLGRIQPRK